MEKIKNLENKIEENTKKSENEITIIKGVEKNPNIKDGENEKKELAEESIKNEETIKKIQSEIKKMDTKKSEEEKEEEKINLPLNEFEIRVFENLGYDRNSIDEMKNKFEKMPLEEVYNEIQILSVEEIMKFLENKKESQSKMLINKLKIILKELKTINDNGDTIKSFNNIIENANEATSSVLMENLNKALKEYGYKGKILGIFGKKNSVESFQEDLIKTFLNEENREKFESLENIIKKNESQYEKLSGMSSLVEGASQIQRNYGKNGFKVKIKDITKNI